MAKRLRPTALDEVVGQKHIIGKDKKDSEGVKEMEKVRRVVAWITIAVIVLLIVGTIYCAITGSKYFFGMFFLMIAVPAVLWVFMWFTKLVNGESEPDLSDSEK